MDSKVELIKEFYAGLPKDRVKLETVEHGFAYLDAMLADGMKLEYGERVLCKEVHKYKFSNVPEWRMDEMLLSHVRKGCNVCLYFQEEMNTLFCFNLDNKRKFNNAVIIPEVALAARLLWEILIDAGCQPLVIASGKGYHLWCRLGAAVSNGKLFSFMVRAMAKALYGLHREGLDHQKINARFYPDPRTENKVSLRLFGSDHMSGKVFSRVLSREGLLDEETSWAAFEEHLRVNTIRVETFENAWKAARR